MQHATRPITLLTILIVVTVSVLAGCNAMPEVVEREATPTVDVTPEVDITPDVPLPWDTEPPEVVDVLSIGNSTVLVTFSNTMGAAAQDPAYYKITRPQLCDPRDWHAQLGVSGAALSPDAMSVTLTTQPQKGVTYQLAIAGVQDQAGSPLALPDRGYQATFAGTAPSSHVDSDDDGISDADEQYGWAVRIVLEDGTVLCRDVSSDPSKPDTDGDGVQDGEEMGNGTDPRSRDTDGDDLKDGDEIHTYFSSPLERDTDGDGLPDGAEANLFKTSPAMADTDGDGATDYEEIVNGGRNPRLADLPQLSLELYGDPLIELQVDYQTGTSSRQQELQRDEEEQVNTDTTSTKMSIENTVKLHTEAEVGTKQWPPSASAKLTTDTKFQHGYFSDTSSAWKDSSVQQSQQNYETWEQENISFDDGKLSVAMKVINQSDLSFKVKDLRVVAYKLEGRGNFTVIGTMSPEPSEWPENGFVLGPGGDFTMTLERSHIGAEIMRALVRNPTALLFEVGSYSIFQLDEWGVKETINYAALGEAVIQRTGVIVVDYGNGTVERYVVATNVARNPDGSGQGVTMSEALSEIIGLDYETREQVPATTSPSPKVLYRVKSVSTFKCDEEEATNRYEEVQRAAVCPEQSNPDIRGFWTVAGTGAEFEAGTVGDFDDIRLTTGQQVTLVYLQDSDGDGIFDREEYLLGTDKNDVDTDGDGLNDYQESKVGWQVAVPGRVPYDVFPDPRFSDLDKDYLSDKEESDRKTDPFLRDTDRDGIADRFDEEPLFSRCLDGTQFGLTAWWDGTVRNDNGRKLAADIWSIERPDPLANNGLMFKDGSRADLSFALPDGSDVFALSTQRDETTRIDVEDHPSLSPNYEHTIAARINWEGLASGASYATLLSKGPSDTATYALYVTADGKIRYTVYRTYYETCSLCIGSTCHDNLCKDAGYLKQMEECVTTEKIATGEWVHVAATFGGDMMRVYVDGEMACEKRTYYEWKEEDILKAAETTKVVDNGDVLRIGACWKPAEPWTKWPFRGMMDDIQFFKTALNDDQIRQLIDLGICAP